MSSPPRPTSEVVAHLVAEGLKAGADPASAVAAALKRLKGAFALAFLFDDQPDLLIGARRGSPLAVGWSDEGSYLGSDALALAPFATSIAYLDEGDWVVLRRDGAQFFDASDAPVERRRLPLTAGSFLVDKGNYRHFMAKEIHEQPEVVGRTLAHYLDLAEGVTRLPFELNFDPKALSRVTISACGTAYYAGLVARYWLERFARLSVEIDIASEFRYRDPPLPEKGLMIVVSQSGETADTLAALRYAKEHGQHILSIVNVETSTIARESDTVAKTLAGPEIGVASTKAFTCQLAVFACLALALGRARGVLTKEQERTLVAELVAAPGQMAEALNREAQIEPVARDVARATSVLYLGRGPSFPLSMEGALKLKELSYIHAEGYAAGRAEARPYRAHRLRDAGDRAGAAGREPGEDRLEPSGGRGAWRASDSDRLAQGEAGGGGGTRRLYRDAGNRGRGFRPSGLRRAGSVARLSRRDLHGQRRRSAAQSGQERHRGVTGPGIDSGRPELVYAELRAFFRPRLSKGYFTVARNHPARLSRPLRAGLA